MIKETIKRLLREEGIFLCGVLPLSQCNITKQYLLSSCGISDGSAVLFAIPYFSNDSLKEERNISAYAVCRDYHAYVSSLRERLTDKLSKLFPKNRFALFTDHSPIDERDAAARCGIGFFGKNGLLITKEYSSYFFIAELITDASLSADPPASDKCLSCNLCISACPMRAHGCDCLSAITQKKGKLSDNETAIIKEHGSCWGCDICQEVCPYTKAATKEGTIFSPIPYFNEENIPRLTSSVVEGMSDEEFSSRAFSWRGKETILRNLKLFDL